MNKILLCMLLIITGCATAESERPHSPELILTMEDYLDWLHGQTFNFKPLKQHTLVSLLVKKYSSRGQLNRDSIALEIGQQLGLWEKQFLAKTLSLESNKEAVLLDQNSEFVIVGSYTVRNKHWWDRIGGGGKQRMLIVENFDKERFILQYSSLIYSDKRDLYDFKRVPI